MAELVATLDKQERPFINDVDQYTVENNLVVVGLRVNDGSTLTATNLEVRGKPHERSWKNVPDDLAFAAEAFYRVMFVDREIPQGHFYDCQAFCNYVLGYSEYPTRRSADDLPALAGQRLATFPFEMRPWVGYALLRNKAPASRISPKHVHSIIALPRRYGVFPESLGVTGDGGYMVVARTANLPKQYYGQRFYELAKAAGANPA